VIVGRTEEQAAITELLHSARSGRGAALCLVGDPGIGKSTLLSWAAATAIDVTVVRTTGVETDFDVPYAGLLDVAGPLRTALDGVPPRQRAALETALGWSDAGEARHHLVAAGALALLAEAAHDRPLLVVIDDLPWVDRESVHALAFAARRLRCDPVAFLLARRAGTEPGESFDATDLALPGLDLDAAGRVVSSLAPGVLRRLLRDTAGNPLALTDAEANLTPAQRRGSAPLPDLPSVGDRLVTALGERVAGLSEPALRAVRLAAAAREPVTGPFVEALRSEGIAAEAALDEAVAARVLDLEETVSFRHPVLRAVVWARTPPAERRSAHRSLAAAPFADARVRLRHRVAGTTGFDDALAEQVTAMAVEDRTRHGYAESSALLDRAARLTSSPSGSARLLAAAAADALVAGDVERAEALARRCLEAGDPQARASALLTLGVIEEYAGSVVASRDHLAEAGDVGRGATRVRALAELALVGYRLGDAEAMASAARGTLDVADPDDPEQRMLAEYMTGASAAFGGRWQDAREPMQRALELLESDPALRDEPRYLPLALTAGVWMGEPERALEFFDRRLQRAREAGALGVLPFALTLLAGGSMVLGRHWLGFAFADEAVQLGRELGYVVDLSTAQELMTWQLASRGRHEEAQEALDEARRLGAAAGVAEGAVQVELMEAYSALCRGDLDTATRVLERRIATDGGRLPNGEYELALAPELVEVYLAQGRTEEARDLAQRHVALHADSPSPLARAHAHRVRGLTAADPDEADAAFAAALDAHQGWPDPLEAARTQLLRGARLRRDGRRTDARRELTSARAVFEELGFATWRDRADAELAASGSRARRGVRRDQSLTAQEVRVALLVAQGLTNREIAASLFLSPKTVEHHVSAALRKTGVRSRTELAVALASADPG
jgi:DNA-binding CsgD family transcriptional regulator